ncbi:MAG TPA: O-antigen ligase family protein [Gaiellaceae bacterium]
MSAETLAQAGAVVAALGLAALVLGRGRPLRLAGIGTWGLGLGLFLPLLAPSASLLLLVALGALGLAAAAGLALLFVRYPWALAFLTLAAAPARFPVHVGGTSANLLVPLYAVIAGAMLALVWNLARSEPLPARELGLLAWPLSLLVGWLGLSLLWSEDVRQGSITLFFFVFPFAALAVALARLPWSKRALVWLYGLLAGMAALFAAVGIGQWLTRDVFWNPKVIVANAYAPFYRVNSLFWDPSIYGRFLVLAILTSLALLLFRAARDSTWEVALGALIVALWVGLVFSFSQSSFVALGLGVILIAALAWRWRAAMAVAVVAAVMIPVGVAAPQFHNVRHNLVGSSASGLNRATSGRLKLVVNGLRVAEDHPVVGVGVGGFTKAYAARRASDHKTPTAASHNTPVTVVSETGAVGLALFAWLVVASFFVAFRGNRGFLRASDRTALAAGILIVAIVVHSQFYNAFFEDPLTWGLLGLAALAARERKVEPA